MAAMTAGLRQAPTGMGEEISLPVPGVASHSQPLVDEATGLYEVCYLACSKAERPIYQSVQVAAEYSHLLDVQVVSRSSFCSSDGWIAEQLSLHYYYRHAYIYK